MKIARAIAAMQLSEMPGRLMYLLASLAVAVVTWMVLHSAARQVSTAGSTNTEAITVMAERAGQSMPVGFVERIRQMDGVADVAFMNYVPVLCRPPATVATLNAWFIPPGRSHALGHEIAPSVMATWNSSERSILVGRQLAQNCHWETGLVIEPMDLISNQPIQIQVADILPPGESGSSDHVAVAHYSYIDRLLPPGSQSRVLVMRVFSNSGVDITALAHSIEEEFAHDAYPVQANPSAEAESMIQRFGNVSALLWLVTSAVGGCAVLVIVSTFAHVTAARRAQMATLLSIGFRRSHLMLGLWLEILLVVLCGAVVGLLAAHGLMVAIEPHVSLYLGRLRAGLDTYALLVFGLCALQFVALVLPFHTVVRLKPWDYRAV